ncbi:MAG TPA: hypothetical protein VGO46_09795 [Gemmatimonadaceae bacterium]|nr:hypothetical protein [Gemmatimonadaceae bacterium]
MLACAFAIAFDRISEVSHSPLEWLLAPGIIGEILVGGVHGLSSESIQNIALGVSNGVFWTAAIWAVFALIRLARALNGKESIKKTD